MRRVLLVASVVIFSILSWSVVEANARAATPNAKLQVARAVQISEAEPDASRYEVVAELSGNVHGTDEAAARVSLATTLKAEATQVEASIVTVDQVTTTLKDGVTLAFRARAFASKTGSSSFAQR